MNVAGDNVVRNRAPSVASIVQGGASAFDSTGDEKQSKLAVRGILRGFAKTRATYGHVDRDRAATTNAQKGGSMHGRGVAAVDVCSTAFAYSLQACAFCKLLMPHRWIDVGGSKRCHVDEGPPCDLEPTSPLSCKQMSNANAMVYLSCSRYLNTK